MLLDVSLAAESQRAGIAVNLRPAEYLLRFDDLCPTMDRAAWERFLPLIGRFNLKPILAVVPENRDPELDREPPFAGFWEAMRGLQAAGATIGLHGYRHLCTEVGRGLIPLQDRTEFAGADRETQQERVRAGLRILRRKGLDPRIWVAPRHGFDLTTLAVLRGEGIEWVSDGFAERPFRYGGLTWIPQQLWGPVEKRSGVWTICLHSNSATDEAVGDLESFLDRFGAQFTSVDRVVAEWPIGQRTVVDRWFHTRTIARIRLSRWRRSMGAA